MGVEYKEEDDRSGDGSRESYELFEEEMLNFAHTSGLGSWNPCDFDCSFGL